MLPTTVSLQHRGSSSGASAASASAAATSSRARLALVLCLALSFSSMLIAVVYIVVGDSGMLSRRAQASCDSCTASAGAEGSAVSERSGKSKLLRQLEPYIIRARSELDGKELQMLPVTILQRGMFASRPSTCAMTGSAFLSGIRPVVLHFDLPYPGNAAKIRMVLDLVRAIREAGDFSRDLRVLFFDGVDVMFQRDGQSLLRAIDKYYADRSWGRKDILLNAETNQFPSARQNERWSQFGGDEVCAATAALPGMPSPTFPYRFLNSGLYTAFWPELIDFLEFAQDKVLSLPESYDSDQQAFFGVWLGKEFAGNPFRQHLHLEYTTELFWAMTWNKAPRPESGCPMHDPRDHVLVDATTGLISNNYNRTTPYVIHFNGTGKEFLADVIKPKVTDPRQYGKAAVVASRLLLQARERQRDAYDSDDSHVNDDVPALLRAARSQNFGDVLDAMTIHARSGDEGRDIAFASLCAML